MALRVPIRFKEEDNTSGLEAERIFDMVEWYLLHLRIDSSTQIVIARALDSINLTVLEWVVLCIIAQQEADTLTTTEIAKKFDLNVPQTTVLLNKMAKKSLIRHKTSTKDRRVKYLHCTREGKRVAFESDQAVQKAMRYWLFDLSDAEIEQYLSIVKKIVKFELPVR